MKLSEFLSYHKIKYSDLTLEYSSKTKYRDSDLYLRWLKMPVEINGYPWLVFTRSLALEVALHGRVYLKDAQVVTNAMNELGLVLPEDNVISVEKWDDIEDAIYNALVEEKLNDRYLLMDKKTFDISFVNKVDTFYDADKRTGFLRYEQSKNYFLFEIGQSEGDVDNFTSNIPYIIKYRRFLSALYRSICNQISRDLGDGSYIPSKAIMLNLLFGLANKVRIYDLPDFIEEHEYILSYEDAVYDSFETSDYEEEDNGLPELYEIDEIAVENFCLNSIEEYHRISLYCPDYCCR